MKVGEYEVPTTVPWNEIEEPLEQLIKDTNEAFQSISDGDRAKLKEVLRNFVTTWCTLQGCKEAVKAFDDKLAAELWRAVNDFFY